MQNVNIYLFVNGKQAIKFKSKNFELINTSMWLGGLPKDFNNNNHHQKDTGLYGNVYDFSIDHSSIANDEILNIHNYLMKKTILYKCWVYLKSICCNDIFSIKCKFFKMSFNK